MGAVGAKVEKELVLVFLKMSIKNFDVL